MIYNLGAWFVRMEKSLIRLLRLIDCFSNMCEVFFLCDTAHFMIKQIKFELFQF